MFKIVRKEIVWGGKKLSIESGKIARQADGAVILTSGDTVILATVVGAKKAKPDIDFFPLTVNPLAIIECVYFSIIPYYV